MGGRTGYSLLDSPNPNGPHFYPTRRQPILAIVVHITAGLEDLDRLDDHSAENTAAYASHTDRKVSWHSGSDTDSVIQLLPPEATAWHCQGYNSCTVGHEISKKHPDWRTMDPLWVDATLRRAAGHLGPLARRLAVPLRKATAAELDRAIATRGGAVGFIGHHELDPDRRADPGRVGRLDTFPWPRFLDLLTAPAAKTSRKDDLLMPAALDDDDARRCLIRQWCWTFWGGPPSPDEQAWYTAFMADKGADLTLAEITDHERARAHRAG